MLVLILADHSHDPGAGVHIEVDAEALIWDKAAIAGVPIISRTDLRLLHQHKPDRMEQRPGSRESGA
jgi:hypothetical protein